LEEQQASCPNRRAAAKPRQQSLANQRLNLKQQKSANENRRGVREEQGAVARIRHY
jgi:hypothetical protein